MSIDYDSLDPGVRETVRRLNEWHFDTTDSGDGVSKLAQGYDPSEMLDVPHVFIRCHACDLVAEAERLMFLLRTAGICVEPVGHSSIFIQANFDPANETANIQLIGVSDGSWRC